VPNNPILSIFAEVDALFLFEKKCSKYTVVLCPFGNVERHVYPIEECPVFEAPFSSALLFCPVFIQEEKAYSTLHPVFLAESFQWIFFSSES
jgi:hypothetical protein